MKCKHIFFTYAHGVPSDDTVRRFFRDMDPKQFQSCFADWPKTLDLTYNRHTSIDGKVSHHSFDTGTSLLHLVSAFASDCRMVLEQEKIADKSNGITAIPKLLALLDLDGASVTIDAMGCAENSRKTSGLCSAFERQLGDFA